MRFYICEHCKNVATKLVDKGTKLTCCNEEMKEMIPNTTEASHEKHVPSVELSNNEVTITIGTAEHPMEENHFIEWIAIKTKKGKQIKYLEPGFAPKATFKIDQELEEVCAYCNIHGLWKD